MSRVKTYLIGRHSHCDFELDGASVSRRHAEIVPLSDGRFFVTDRNSTAGTFILRDGKWLRVRQTFVEPTEYVRFGKQKIEAARFKDLISKEPYNSTSFGAISSSSLRLKILESLKFEKSVKRHPETGEIIEK